MTEVTSQQEQQDEGSTDEERPDGETPVETPAPSEPEQPAEPEEKPQPEPEPEPEQKPEAKEKPKAKPKAKAKPKLPASQTKAGRKKQAAEQAKPKRESKEDRQKAAERKRELVAEFKRMNERASREDGHDAQMRRKMRGLAEKLGRKAPKWALVGAQAAKERKPKELSADAKLAKEMTAFAVHGKVENGKVVNPTRKFGADVTEKQIGIMRERIKGKNVLQMLGGLSESKLRQFAHGDIKRTDLPDEAKAALKALNDGLDAEFPTAKFWVRKDAVILYFLHMERKRSQSKQKKDEAKQQVAA